MDTVKAKLLAAAYENGLLTEEELTSWVLKELCEGKQYFTAEEIIDKLTLAL